MKDRCVMWLPSRDTDRCIFWEHSDKQFFIPLVEQPHLCTEDPGLPSLKWPSPTDINRTLEREISLWLWKMYGGEEYSIIREVILTLELREL